MKKSYFKSKKKILFIALIILLMTILLVLGIIKSLEKNVKDNSNQTQYESIEQILNSYGCKYIKEKKSKDSNYFKDIYLEFKYNTFEKNESQKRYYENIISTLASFIKENYRLIDEKKQLVVEVQKKVLEQGIVNYVYAINGKQNYFQEQESKILLENYKEDKLTNLQINSEIINNLIKNKWNYKNVSFGTKDSSFEKYDIYFDEGIEVRKIEEKIYNVVFTKNNTEELVNGIKVGTSFDEIILKLGNPTYGSEDSNIIGYRNNNIYVFFSEEEISIYRYEEYKTEKFEELLSTYINKEIDIKEFMNKLTYLWPDYSSYQYDSSYINIKYPLKGLEINMFSDDPKGINIYNNYQGISNIKDYINNNKITARTDENLLYIEEIGRIAVKDQLLYICLMQREENNNLNESELFAFYTENNKINFVSKDRTRPNTTITDNMNSGFWYSDTKFIYSVKNEGIYLYDIETKNKTVIEEGKKEYTFEKYENNVLTFDEGKQIEIIN